MLKAAYEKHRIAMRKNTHGLESPITLNEVLAAWERREVRCATTGWTDDLRIVPARPGAFTATNMELVHRTLYAVFKMDGEPGSCYQALLGGGVAKEERPRDEAFHEEALLGEWTATRPLRFVVEGVLATASMPVHDDLFSAHDEALDHSCAALRVRSPSGSRIVMVVAVGAPTFLSDFPPACCDWELPDGASPPSHWDRARGGLLCRLFGDPPAVPPVCVITHRRPTLGEVRLPNAMEVRLRTAEMMYSMFGGLWSIVDMFSATRVLNIMKSQSAQWGPARLMNHRSTKNNEGRMPRVEPSAMGGSALAAIGVTTAHQLAVLCCARRMTDTTTEAPFDEDEFAAQEGALADSQGEDWSTAQRIALEACEQLIRAGKLSRSGGLLAWI